MKPQIPWPRVFIDGVVIAGSIFAVSGAAAEAQRSPVVAGERVRLTVERVWVGSVERATADSIVVLPDGAAAALPFAIGSLERLEVYAGQKSRTRGALIGAGIGGGVGLVGGLIANSDCQEDLGVLEVACAPVAPFMTLGGLVVGGLIGALAGGGDRWDTVSLPQGRGVVFGLSDRFTIVVALVDGP